MIKLIVALTVFAFVSIGINAIHFKDCGSKQGSFSNIIVSGCDTTLNSCTLARNTTVSITIDFTSNIDSSSLKAVVHGIVMGVAVPFALPNPDGCTDSNVSCPVAGGKSYSYIASLPVLSEYPKVSVKVKWELKDENDEDIVCVLIPAKVE